MTIRSLIGDCRTILPTLADGSVHCVVTSPPYFGLRDYGTATWEGGSAECDHSTPRSRGEDIKIGDKQGTSGGSRPNTQRQCDCGAVRIDSQIGLEPAPQAYVEQMATVFREVRRVLRDDGTLWLNLGDSYGGAKGNNYLNNGKLKPNCDLYPITTEWYGKPKDLLGIPWRVAFALQADGWYLRQDIIWAKPNPMPESVTDRCTKAHEYIFLLSKNARYYYDAEAIAEKCADDPNTQAQKASKSGSQYDSWQDRQGFRGNGALHNGARQPQLTRNKRSVWEIATQPYSEAHFATFPPALIEPCILAGCPKLGTVLDPFGGAGTTGMVADRLGRNAIMIELNPAYAQLAEYRIRDDAGMFADII